MLRDYGRVRGGTARRWLVLPHSAFVDCAVAVKPEKGLWLLQELDEGSRAGAARARDDCAAGDPALECCLGLCCQRMCSDRKWLWVG
jgi:hypothetical protein